MTDQSGITEQPSQRSPRKLWLRILLWTGGIVLVLFIAALVTVEVLLHRAEPMLKARVVDALSTRYDSRVELGRFHVYVLRGIEVSGGDLKLWPNQIPTQQPLFAVQEFSFRLSWREALEKQIRIETVHLKGLRIDLPPKQMRQNMPHLNSGSSASPGSSGQSTGKGTKFSLGELLANDTVLILENGKPGKVPLEFDISKLKLDSVGPNQPMNFHAILVNPKPVGNIDSTGQFGPFIADSPGDTPVRGTYTFRHADLNTIKGIGGILSSDGQYQGTLGNIVVDGETQTPDFSIDTANHPMPLNTKFHAIVDGTNGDTHLQPVDAWLAHTHIIARGDVVRAQGQKGHNITLDVTVDQGRIQDLLSLAVKTQPALMTGQVTMHTKLHLPPGEERVAQKLQLDGDFHIVDVHFTSDKIQARVDELSLRGQGRPQDANQEGKAQKQGGLGDNAANIASEMSGDFLLGDSRLSVTDLHYRVPGADIALDGTYSLESDQFDFHGNARLQAKISEMVTGWKSLLLKPVDPFFSKNGAGTDVPIHIDGTRSDPHFGLDFGHKANMGKEKNPQ